MHIPPGFLKPEVWISMTGISAASVGYALKKTSNDIDERRMPVMGVLAAFIFAAQMVNFPVAGGTSGHLIGSALAVAVLGLWPAMIVMTSVIFMQALLFQDGGLDALGANVFNMGILGCLISGPLIGLGRKLGRAEYPSLAIAAWLTVVAASVLCAVELALSGTTPLRIALPAMAAVHAIIGVFEGFVTVIAFRFILSVKPDILNGQRNMRP
ncbi:MAG: energy-coupling factor ABC transporter permease [Candidatus Latescibacteria bacterium]|nr:energy-coupling factor ABC transporter permease [Candidatus Latescibacterota bacterium]